MSKSLLLTDVNLFDDFDWAGSDTNGVVSGSGQVTFTIATN
jgi:hypothetical protein